jgi:hypothetical protein
VLYRVYDTEAEALAAEAAISAALGYPASGTNAATGEEEPEVVTVRWAVPQQIVDGRWVFPSPDAEGVQADPSWWPAPSEPV